MQPVAKSSPALLYSAQEGGQNTKGCMPVTLKDVAEKAGVSRSAVSRTFTEGASVSAKPRRQVEIK